MKRRALITGVGGQDGSYLAELLVDQGYAVAGVVRREPGVYAENLARVRDRIEFLEVDLLASRSIAGALRSTRPHEVYNLASPSFVPRSWDEPVLTAEFAAVGVTALLEAVREADPGIRVYQASSSEIFGEPTETPQDEETSLSPVTPYGVAKAYGHFIAHSYRRRYGLFACCGILYNHESPRRPLDFLPRKVAHAAAAISLGIESELVLGDLEAR
ncbi:MAG TPA: GDP-mannose 4,6-dehydratase, partial [Gaiellaceae bacterium]|nr:GDP-mannose 4,6-dehydratase [Gaiellaceae bacterium]